MDKERISARWLDLLVLVLVLATVVLFSIRKLKSYVNQSIGAALVPVSEEVSGITQNLLAFEQEVLALKDTAAQPTPVAAVASEALEVVSEPKIPAPAPTPSVSGAINLNTASLGQLMELPGIGQSYAQRIIEGRPYSAVEQLTNVKGIGDKTLAKIRDLVVVQ